MIKATKIILEDMVKLVLSFFIVTILFLPSVTYADYYVRGQVMGDVCKGFGIKTCSKVEIHAVDDSSGKLYALQNKYSNVDEYRNGLCTIYVNMGGGIVSKIFSSISMPNFYTKSNGKYKKVNVEYLQFKCRKK